MLKDGVCILVEGQMDLLMAHQIGTKNTVAVSGTALTDEHLKLIKRFTDKLLLAFDADNAGVRASERSVRLALSEDMDVKIIKLPEGLDPADAILKDRKIWDEAIEKSAHIVDFYLELLSEKGYDERTFKIEVSKRVLPYVAAISNSIDQAHFVSRVAHVLGVGEDTVRTEVKKMIEADPERKIAPLPEISSLSASSTLHVLESALSGILAWQQTLPDKAGVIIEMEKRYESITGLPLAKKLENMPDSEKENLILKTELYYRDRSTLTQDIDELLVNLEREMLGVKFSNLLIELRVAEREGYNEKAQEILEACQKISSRINNLKHHSRP